MLRQMNVSIIIVNYNTKKLLVDCITSIYKYTKEVIYEIIVVDNSSVDGSQVMLKENFPNVKLIESEINLGFGKANNLGAKEAMGKYLFFLNSDTILLNNAIKIFFDFMESENTYFQIGAAGGILLNKNKTPTFSYGFFPTIYNEINYLYKKCIEKIHFILKQKSYVLINQFIENPFIEVDYIVGADLFIPNKIFNDIGGFDPDFFMYYEETDLQKRMLLAGLKRIIIPGPEIIHLEGGSMDSPQKFTFPRFKLSQKSLNIYLKKYFNGFNYYLFRFTMVALRMTILFDKRFSFSEKIQAFKIIVKG